MLPGPSFDSTNDLQYELGEELPFFSIEKCCCYHEVQACQKFTITTNGGYLAYRQQAHFSSVLSH